MGKYRTIILLRKAGLLPIIISNIVAINGDALTIVTATLGVVK